MAGRYTGQGGAQPGTSIRMLQGFARPVCRCRGQEVGGGAANQPQVDCPEPGRQPHRRRRRPGPCVRGYATKAAGLRGPHGAGLVHRLCTHLWGTHVATAELLETVGSPLYFAAASPAWTAWDAVACLSTERTHGPAPFTAPAPYRTGPVAQPS